MAGPGVRPWRPTWHSAFAAPRRQALARRVDEHLVGPGISGNRLEHAVGHHDRSDQALHRRLRATTSVWPIQYGICVRLTPTAAATFRSAWPRVPMYDVARLRM